MVKLYRATGDARYLNFAKYFIDERGQERRIISTRNARTRRRPGDFWAQTYNYCQAHKPLREQTEATGHAVRACYLYAGVADVALETQDEELVAVSRRLWDDLTSHQMYITGGLGPAHSNEGFTFAYDLPNETAYAETCAAIALVFWAQRMFHLDPDRRYIDVMERALYNMVLSGVSHEGDHFFYANPLASYPNVNPHEHFSGDHLRPALPRSPWFFCPCCPPNAARLVASIGSYILLDRRETGSTCICTKPEPRGSRRSSWTDGAALSSRPLSLGRDIEILRAGRKCPTADVRPGAAHSRLVPSAYTREVNGAAASRRASNAAMPGHLAREWANGDSVDPVTGRCRWIASHAHPIDSAGRRAASRCSAGRWFTALRVSTMAPGWPMSSFPRTARCSGLLRTAVVRRGTIITGEAAACRTS
jgi:hypothetical protein